MAVDVVDVLREYDLNINPAGELVGTATSLPEVSNIVTDTSLPEVSNIVTDTLDSIVEILPNSYIGLATAMAGAMAYRAVRHEKAVYPGQKTLDNASIDFVGAMTRSAIVGLGIVPLAAAATTISFGTGTAVVGLGAWNYKIWRKKKKEQLNATFANEWEVTSTPEKVRKSITGKLQKWKTSTKLSSVTGQKVKNTGKWVGRKSLGFLEGATDILIPTYDHINASEYLGDVQSTDTPEIKKQKKNIKKFLAIAKLANSRGNKKSGENEDGDMPYQALRDKLSDWIPGYDQDDLVYINDQDFIQQIFQRATQASIEHQNGVFPERRNILMAMENFGKNVEVYPAVQNLLKTSNSTRANRTGDFIKFLEPKNKILRDIVLQNSEVSSFIIHKINSLDPSLDLDGARKQRLQRHTYDAVLDYLPDNNDRKKLWEAVANKGIVLPLLEKALENNPALLYSITNRSGGARQFNELHDACLGKDGAVHQKIGVKGLWEKLKGTPDETGEIQESTSKRIFSVLKDVGGNALALKEVYDLSKPIIRKVVNAQKKT